MKISNAFPSKYLKAADLQDKPVTLVMARVDLESIADGEDKKPVLFFTKAKKGLVLNKTNSKVIAAAYGDDTDMWDGKTLVLFPAMVDFRGDTVEAIRVRVPKPAAAPKPAPEPISEVNPPPHDMDDDIPF
jgi:hypothetical protein